MRGTTLLVAAGLLSAVNGAAHFALPVMYSWDQHAEGLYEPVQWALFATTWFFALLLMFVGVLTVLMATARNIPTRVVVWVAGGMAGFWLVAAGYEIVVPFPAEGASWALPAFSVIVAALHATGLWLRLNNRKRTSHVREPHEPEQVEADDGDEGRQSPLKEIQT